MFATVRIVLINLLITHLVVGGPEEEQGVKYATKCEVCKVVAAELEARLNETGKIHDVLEIGYLIDDVAPKKKKEYKKSELRLVDSLENVCERILEYNIHKERSDGSRFAKGMSQTFKTLHGLVNKGVKVELGIPYELWDKPSVEITTLKSQCESLIEDHEPDIEEWYYNKQGTVSLIQYLCADRALKDDNNDCLKEKGETSELRKSTKNEQKKHGQKKSKSKVQDNKKTANEEL